MVTTVVEVGAAGATATGAGAGGGGAGTVVDVVVDVVPDGGGGAACATVVVVIVRRGLGDTWCGATTEATATLDTTSVTAVVLIGCRCTHCATFTPASSIGVGIIPSKRERGTVAESRSWRVSATAAHSVQVV